MLGGSNSPTVTGLDLVAVEDLSIGSPICSLLPREILRTSILYAQPPNKKLANSFPVKC